MDFDKPSVFHNDKGAKSTDFSPGRWWGSVGDTNGRNFPNETATRTIYGMRLKVKFPKIGGAEGDTFTTDSTGGSAFPDVWRKNDGTELIFHGPGIAPGSYFWQKVPKTDDTDVRNRFFGQLYDAPGQPPVPTDGTWQKISATIPQLPDKVIRATNPPVELQQKVFLFAQSIEDSKDNLESLKRAVGRGDVYYGKPYFLGASNFGKVGYFTFWLINPNNRTYRSFSVDVTQATGKALMKTVLFGFEQKAQWIVVTPQPDDPNTPLYVTVYP